LRVEAIVLAGFGGFTWRPDAGPRWIMFRTAIAGPLASGLGALLFGLLSLVLPEDDGVLDVASILCFLTALFHFASALAEIAPVFLLPTDGTRMVRIWREAAPGGR
jgi:hypothetical protein